MPAKRLLCPQKRGLPRAQAGQSIINQCSRPQYHNPDGWGVRVTASCSSAKHQTNPPLLALMQKLVLATVPETWLGIYMTLIVDKSLNGAIEDDPPSYYCRCCMPENCRLEMIHRAIP